MPAITTISASAQIFAQRLNSNHAYFAANTPTSKESPLKRASTSLFSTRSLSRSLFLYLCSRIYLCCVNEFRVLSCEASGRFSYPGVVRARHQKTPGSSFLLRHSSGLLHLVGPRTLPGCRLPGCCLPRYGLVEASCIGATSFPTLHREIPPPHPPRCLPLSSMSRFIHPRSLSVLLLLSDERRRRAPSSSVERETLSRDGARLAACLSGAGEPAPTQTRGRTYTHRKHQT